MFWKIMAITSAVAGWAAKAAADGKIDATEAAELITLVGTTLGIKTTINLPDIKDD